MIRISRVYGDKLVALSLCRSLSSSQALVRRAWPMDISGAARIVICSNERILLIVVPNQGVYRSGVIESGSHNLPHQGVL